jgi:hypothetical protein
LALFPLVFNLSFAQEAGVGIDETEKNFLDSSEPHPDPLLLGEGNHEVVGEVNDEKEDELQPQEDEEDAVNPSVSLRSPDSLTGSETLEDDFPLCEERGTACGGEVDENIENPQSLRDTSFTKEQKELDVQDSLLYSE